MNDSTKSVILSGLALGVLSGLPLVNFVNLACCLWVVGGGFLSVYLFKHFSGKHPDAGKGAVLGLGSGLVGALISTAINSVFQLMAIAASSWMEQFGNTLGYNPFGQFGVALVLVLGLFFNLVIYGIFGLVGGIIAASVLKD